MKNRISAKKLNRIKEIVRHFKSCPPYGYSYILLPKKRPLKDLIDDYWIREIELENRVSI